MRLEPADGESRVEEIAASCRVDDFLDVERRTLHEVLPVEAQRPAHAHRRAADLGAILRVDLSHRSLGVACCRPLAVPPRKLQYELLGAYEKIGQRQELVHSVAVGACVIHHSDARLARDLRRGNRAGGVVSVEMEHLRGGDPFGVYLVRRQLVQSLARPRAGARARLLLDPEVGDCARRALPDLDHRSIDALAREVVEDHPPVRIVAHRADERRAHSERRRACSRVRRGPAAHDGVGDHLHLSVHRNERQHREVVVRAEAEADIIRIFHHGNYTTNTMRVASCLLERDEKT